jgi:hypothetical protein
MNPQRDPLQRSLAPPPVPIIIWQDVFVVVDQGAIRALDYAAIEAMGRDHIATHASGVAVLVIIPSVARPPAEEVRRAITTMLSRSERHLRCVCWLVEGTGFRAAAVRAALTGLQMVNKSPYPTRVCSELGEALRWILPHMANGRARLDSVVDAVNAIAVGRHSIRPLESS